MKNIYIVGHKNPDVDSICSAIAYANLKEQLNLKNYQPRRCGNSNLRIDRVLNKFKVPLPKLLTDVRLKTKDVMRTDFRTLPANSSCYEVMNDIEKFDLRAMPLVDDENKLLGEVSIFDLGEFFIPKTNDVNQIRKVSATLNDIIKTLNAKVYSLFDADKQEDMFVRVAAMEVNSFGSFIVNEGLKPQQNLIVVGDRFDIQIKAIQMGVKAIILSANHDIDSSVIAMAKDKKVSVISCDYDSATTSLLVRMATRALPIMRKDLVVVSKDILLSEIYKNTKDYYAKNIYVCDEDNRIEGVFGNTDLLNVEKPKLLLVDHNEMSQAVSGANEAEIVEIIDHHRIGDANTMHPILFINKPVGATCTIISQLFTYHNKPIDKKIAGLLLSGIIADTLNLKSPTATNDDLIEAEKLESIVGISRDDLAKYIFESSSIINSNRPEDVIVLDCKSYEENGKKFSISQVEELDFTALNANLETLRNELNNYRDENKFAFCALFVTNVLTQDSILLLSADNNFVSKIGFAKNIQKNYFELTKIVSRKKQLVPYLTSLLREISF